MTRTAPLSRDRGQGAHVMRSFDLYSTYRQVVQNSGVNCLGGTSVTRRRIPHVVVRATFLDQSKRVRKSYRYPRYPAQDVLVTIKRGAASVRRVIRVFCSAQ